MYRLICSVAICASAFVAGPHKALHSACTSSSNTPSPRRRRGTFRRANGDDDDAVEDLIRRARALRADAAQTEAALVEETVLDDESAANYADELGLADAVLEERRKEARRLAAEMLKEPEDTSKWPKFSNKEAPDNDNPLQGGALDNVFGGPAPRFELTAEKMEDPELQRVVRRQLVDAFDNRREDEVELMFSRLWHAGPIKTVKKLVEAVLDAQDVYQAYSNNLLSDERAADEIRCCRSRIRMYAKDAEFLPNADGSPANDTWGSLGDFIPWRWRP